MLLENCPEWIRRRDRSKWRSGPWYKIQSQVCNVVGSIFAEGVLDHCLACQPRPCHRFPWRQWKRPDRTIAIPTKRIALATVTNEDDKSFVTICRKKSTWGRLWTKNRTGCRSIVTLRIKSGGVPGRTVGLKTPSWNECIKVSSKSRTRVFRLTILSLCFDKGDNGYKL